MKTRPRPRTKAEDVPAPTAQEFKRFVNKLLNVPKEEIDHKQAQWKRRKKTTGANKNP